MPTQPGGRDKLVPLRKFAVDGVYSSSYLSQLVQRGKLKAKKIGRNYYTCDRWFREYLDLHARDEKQSAYKKHGNIKTRTGPVPMTIPAAGPDNQSQNIQYVLTPVQAPPAKPWKQIAITLAVFLCFISVGFGFYILSDNGRVAGVEEGGGFVGSSSLQSTKIQIPNNK
jgi:hypothetical protein